MIQYSLELLDEFVAPKITGFTQAELSSFGSVVAEFDQWMLIFGIQDVLGKKLKPMPARAYRQFARRTVAAVRSFENMRMSLGEFFENHVIDSPKTSKYFQALDAAEICLLQCQMAFEVFHRGELVSGLKYEDLSLPIRNLANGIKHFGERTLENRSANTLIPVWFENRGIVGSEGCVEFRALEAELDEMVKTSKVMLGATNI